MLFSAFFWSYALIQIPTGIFLDRYSSKKVLMIAISLLGAGCIFFAFSPNFLCALIRRVIMGIGAGFGFIGMVFVLAKYFPVALFPFVLGLGEAFSMFGVSFIEQIAPLYILKYGWKFLLLGSAALCLISLFLMIFFLPKENTFKINKIGIFSDIYISFKNIITVPNAWIAGIFCCGTFSVLTAFIDVWGGNLFSRSS